MKVKAGRSIILSNVFWNVLFLMTIPKKLSVITSLNPAKELIDVAARIKKGTYCTFDSYICLTLPGRISGICLTLPGRGSI